MAIWKSLGRGAALALVLGLGALFAAAAQAAQTEVYAVNPAFSPHDATGRAVTVKGVGFTPSTTVLLDGTAASVTYVDSRTLVVFLPTVPSPIATTVTVSDPANGSAEFFPFLYTGPVYYVSTTGDDGNDGASSLTPKQTLAAALALPDAATPSEIRVAGGEYVESQLSLQSMSVLSCGWAPTFGLRDPDSHVTVIDGNRRGYVLRTGGLENVSVIDSCTIRNGFRDAFGGGGIPISADSAVVNNSVIVGNGSSTMGGGIYFRSSTTYGGLSTFSNNVIIGNRATNKNGGGIVIYGNYNTQQPVRVNVTNNRIVGNRTLRGRGAGIALVTGSYIGYNTGTINIIENMIGHNRAKAGAGIDFSPQTFGDFFEIAVNDNLVFKNSALGSGGGVELGGMGAYEGTFTGNTLAENVGAPSQGGGLVIGGAVTLFPTFEARDLILWNNAGGDAAGLAPSLVTYTNAGTLLPGAGNISADPDFVHGTLSNYYLRQADPNLPDSPAVDAGSAPALDLSLEGMTTRTDGAFDAGTVDMGYHYPAAPSASTQPIALDRIDPILGDFKGNDWILIRGNGFDPGIQVEVGGVPATEVIFLTNRRLLARPAPAPPGFAHVKVINPDATFDQEFGLYLYKDIEPPEWSSTVGLVSATSGLDACQRTVLLEWNAAMDLDSPPVIYEIYKVECEPPLFPGDPCDNFGYLPNSTNFLGTTLNTTWVDVGITGSQDSDWIYMVRARDSEQFVVNREYNFARKVATATHAGTEIPPAEVGDSLGWRAGTVDTLDWAVSTAATAYGVYRETDPSGYATPGSLTKLITLDAVNNDGNGDGVVDNSFLETTLPAVGQAFYYKISALDPCSGETLSEL